MVSTFEIKPAPVLRSYINCYALRCFNTNGLALPRPMYAVEESYLTFFLKEKNFWHVDAFFKRREIATNSLCSLFTQTQGCTWYNGDYSILCVQFAANGISAIFGIPQRILTNSILPAGDLLGKHNQFITEQLSEMNNNIEAMGKLLNDYFTKRLLMQKHEYYTNMIAHIANIIFRSKEMVSIGDLGKLCNMNLRTLERRFSEEVGMPPKLYMRIVRFQSALQNKMLHPEKNWTDICYESSYFDQAHFIKECREFSSMAPEELFKSTPPPKEKIIIIGE